MKYYYVYSVKDNKIIENLIKKKLNKIITQKHNLNLSYRFWFCRKNKNTKEERIFNILSEQFNKQFDIIQYLHNIFKFKIVKKILFNPAQDELVNFISIKPFTFTITEDGVRYKKTKKEKNYENIAKYLIKEDKSDIDKELFKFLIEPSF